MSDINTMSYEEVLKLAESGDTEAMVNLGVRLWEGDGAKKDSKKAMEYFINAANKDNPQASYLLGMIYLSDDEYMDLKKAVSSFEAAADLKFAPAMTELAVMLINGDGIEKDAQRAAKLLTMAAKLGDERAEELLESTDDGSFDGGSEFISVDDIVKKSEEFCTKVFYKRLFGRERKFEVWYDKYSLPIRVSYLYINFRTSDAFNRERFQEALNTLAVEEITRLGIAKTDAELELRNKIIEVYRNEDTLFNNFYSLGMINNYSEAVNICLSLMMDSIPEEDHHKEEKTIMTELRKVFFE